MKKNLRYLTASLATTAFLASSSSYALGVGDIKMQSALNQNLKAEIALILSDGENPADLKIDLAPLTKFDDAGIPWSLFLSKIQFQTVTEHGRTFIKLSSKEVLKEPFLDFIVQIRGLKNHLYREFTVLVDPPEAYQSLEEPEIQKENIPQHFVSAPVNHVIQKQRNIPVHPKITATKTVAKITTPPKIEHKTILPTPATVAAAPTPELNQKVVELEKQLSEMKQVMTEQNAQIAALKISNSQPPIVQPEIKPELTSPQIVVPVAPEPVLETPMPVVATPIVPTAPQPKPQISSPVAPDLITEILNSVSPLYSSISTDSYSYIAGAASSLLLSVLGLLRWKNRRNTQKQNESENRVEPEIVSKNEIQPIVEVENLLSSSEQSMDKMFANEDMSFEEENTDFEKFEIESLSVFNSLTNNDKPKNNASDVLYRVDVYCAYGNFDHAILLLNDEFVRHPDINDFALRLLHLYVSQHKTEEFKTFVEKLVQQGKQTESEFWSIVSGIVTDFYPDIFLPEQPNFSKSNEEIEPFIFENLSDFENQEEPQFSLDSEFDTDLDFAKFDIEKENKTEEPQFLLDSEFNMDLDFAKFDVEKESKTEEPQFSLDSEFKLDFTTFEPEKDVEVKAPKITFEPEFELDFTSFDMPKNLEINKLE